ncbi:MAG: DUF3135 domain-containing protein [Betaproteobacteria bacterium]|nr:DUF3135 domain-containing protein [Betaproteobacteria bacterium]
MKQTRIDQLANDLNDQAPVIPAAVIGGTEMGHGTPVMNAAPAPLHPAMPGNPVLKDGDKQCPGQLRELPSHELLSHLAHKDPNAFETLRRELVENFIDNAPEKYRARLNGLQFRVDCERRVSRSALGSTLRIYKLMWESFSNLNDEWQKLVRTRGQREYLRDSAVTVAYLPKESARIIDFRPRCAQEPD